MYQLLSRHLQKLPKEDEKRGRDSFLIRVASPFLAQTFYSLA